MGPVDLEDEDELSAGEEALSALSCLLPTQFGRMLVVRGVNQRKLGSIFWKRLGPVLRR